MSDPSDKSHFWWPAWLAEGSRGSNAGANNRRRCLWDLLWALFGSRNSTLCWMDTTVVVDSGTYGIVRHPQALGCILLMSGSILVSQHWLSAIPGVLMSAWFYTELPKEERGLILRFGDPYKRYMQKVPRVNLLLGVIRLLRRKRMGS